MTACAFLLPDGVIKKILSNAFPYADSFYGNFLFRRLVGGDFDAATLFDVAIATAKERVVMKLPAFAEVPPLSFVAH